MYHELLKVQLIPKGIINENVNFSHLWFYLIQNVYTRGEDTNFSVNFWQVYDEGS